MPSGRGRAVRRHLRVLLLGVDGILELSPSQATFNIPFLRNPPRAMQALFGCSVDFLHPGRWLVIALAHPITLVLFTAAALIVPGAIATDIERGTIDFVLSRPIRRPSFIL